MLDATSMSIIVVVTVWTIIEWDNIPSGTRQAYRQGCTGSGQPCSTHLGMAAGAHGGLALLRRRICDVAHHGIGARSAPRRVPQHLLRDTLAISNI